MAIGSLSQAPTDSFANVKRIEAVVKALDTGTPYKSDRCEPPLAAAHRENR